MALTQDMMQAATCKQQAEVVTCRHGSHLMRCMYAGFRIPAICTMPAGHGIVLNASL